MASPGPTCSPYEVATTLYDGVTVAGTGVPPEVAGPGMTWGTFLPIAPPAPGQHKFDADFAGARAVGRVGDLRDRRCAGLPSSAPDSRTRAPAWKSAGRHLPGIRASGSDFVANGSLDAESSQPRSPTTSTSAPPSRPPEQLGSSDCIGRLGRVWWLMNLLPPIFRK